MDTKNPQPEQTRPQKKPSREIYTAPSVTFVELVVEEALMSICKGGIGSGPIMPGCSGGEFGCMGGGS